MHVNSNASQPKSMDIEGIIKNKLEKSLDLHYFSIKDFTGRHLNHKTHDGGFHLEAVIVSDSFSDLNLVKRHQMVYNILDKLIQKEIHALSMKTLTITEWEKDQK